jgi:hypothetical protein
VDQPGQERKVWHELKLLQVGLGLQARLRLQRHGQAFGQLRACHAATGSEHLARSVPQPHKTAGLLPSSSKARPKLASACCFSAASLPRGTRAHHLLNLLVGSFPFAFFCGCRAGWLAGSSWSSSRRSWLALPALAMSHPSLWASSLWLVGGWPRRNGENGRDSTSVFAYQCSGPSMMPTIEAEGDVLFTRAVLDHSTLQRSVRGRGLVSRVHCC